MSYADEYTEAEIKLLGGKIAREYKSIQKDIQRDAEEYFARFADEQAKKLAKVKAGELSKAEYEQWARNKMLYGKRYEDLESRVVDRLVNANNVAANYINGTAKDVFALNNRFQQFKMEQGTGISLSMYDDNTINRLIAKSPKLLPKAKVNIPKNEKWNQKKMRKTLASGIVRGLSVKELSNDLGAVTTMNKNSALRNARTMVTGAQNSGRLESMLRFKEETGIDIKKEWMATNDARTRDSHAYLNGEQVPVDEEFSNGCMCPGDPNGKPEEVYNCRCTLRMIMPDVIERKDKNEDDTLQEFTFHVGMNVRYGGQKIGYKSIPLTQSRAAKEKADFTEWAKDKKKQSAKITAVTSALNDSFKGTLQEQQSTFVEAKSSKEAEEYARDVLGVPTVNYKGVDVGIANELNKVVFETFEKDGNLREHVRFLGSEKNRKKMLKAELYDWNYDMLKTKGFDDDTAKKLANSVANDGSGKIHPNARALAYPRVNNNSPEVNDIHNKYCGIVVNDKYDLEKLKQSREKSVKTMHNPVGTEAPRATFDHEMGHVYDFAYDLKGDEVIVKLYNEISDKKEVLSGYANENIKEFIAEGYAESVNNKNPREIASIIGKRIAKRSQKV